MSWSSQAGSAERRTERTLSYTSFGYGDLAVRPSHGDGRQVTVTVRVTNTGRRAGAEVVQLYLGSPPSAAEPPRQLKGFQKVQLGLGQSTRVAFRLDAQALAGWGDPAMHRWTTYHGAYRVMVGSSSRDIRAEGTFTLDR